MLAGLVGRSEDWLSNIERGAPPTPKLEVLMAIAKALRITLNDLLGQPVLLEDDEHNDDVPAVRDALMAPRRLSRVLFERAPDPRIDPVAAAVRTERGWAEYQAGRLAAALTALPELIQTAQHLEDIAADASPEARRRCLAVSARTHHLAATSLIKVGESDLSWIAAERAMDAADRSGDPLVLASAARSGAHALLSIGRYDDALELGATAATWLHDRLDETDPEALSLYGMLHLRAAVAASHRQERATAGELLDRAEAAADRLGHDGNYWQTGFGPTNVRLHRVSVALELGDAAWVIENGPRVSAAGMPTERRVSLMLDIAHALSWTASDDAALDRLLDAEREAPQLVRTNPLVRETVRTMARRAPVSGGRSSELRALAVRCRAVA